MEQQSSKKIRIGDFCEVMKPENQKIRLGDFTEKNAMR
jgi:hypothetical protein